MTWHEPGGLFGDRGPIAAACVLGLPSVVWREDLWELRRLVRKPHVTAPITRLVAAALAEIRRQGLADLIVSYADPAAGHHGGIYQAASWSFAAERKPMRVGWVIDGKEIHNRTLNAAYGTNVGEALAARFPGSEIAPLRDQGRYLYWRALNRRGKAKAKRLGLKSLPYPKPGREAS
jgi:hypothetical protein